MGSLLLTDFSFFFFINFILVNETFLSSSTYIVSFGEQAFTIDLLHKNFYGFCTENASCNEAAIATIFGQYPLRGHP